MEFERHGRSIVKEITSNQLYEHSRFANEQESSLSYFEGLGLQFKNQFEISISLPSANP